MTRYAPSPRIADCRAKRKTREIDPYEETTSDVFWLASRRLPNIVDMIQARGWLATVTTRLVGRRLRRRRFRRVGGLSRLGGLRGVSR